MFHSATLGLDNIVRLQIVDTPFVVLFNFWSDHLLIESLLA